MEIKCPKCRFRYETEVSAGITEVACVCPRCGVPFSFVVTAADAQPSSDANQHQAAPPHYDGGSSKPLRGDQSEQEIHSGTTADGTQETPSAPISAAQSPPISTPIPSIPRRGTSPGQSIAHASRQSHGCLRNCLLIFIVTFVVAVFLVRNYNESRSYNQEVLKYDDEAADDSASPFISSHTESTPEWLEGSWRLDNGGKVVVITIYGHRIVRLQDGRESRGKFYYKRGKLNCDFNDGKITTLKVNTKRRCIIYESKEMEKQ